MQVFVNYVLISSSISGRRSENLQGDRGRQHGQQEGDRPLLQAYPEGARHQRRHHPDRRLHAQILRNSRTSSRSSKGGNSHREPVRRSRHRARTFAHLRCGGGDLHGVAGVARQEDSARNRGHRRSGRRHYQAVVQVDAAQGRRAVSGWVQLCDSDRESSSKLKTFCFHLFLNIE